MSTAVDVVPIEIRRTALFGLEWWEVYAFGVLQSQWSSEIYAERRATELRRKLLSNSLSNL